jgi:hypothetical protein
VFPPPLVQAGGGDYTLARGRGGGAIPTREQTLFYSRYICTLWGEGAGANSNDVAMSRDFFQYSLSTSGLNNRRLCEWLRTEQEGKEGSRYKF